MKMLIVGPSWIGDMMMSHSLYRSLAKRNPSLEIHVIAPAWCQPLLKHMPEVKQALVLPFGHGTLELVNRWRLGKLLQKANYQQAIILPNSFKSALLPYFARIPRRIGWRGEMRYGLLNDQRVLDRKAFPSMFDRYVALAYDAQTIHCAADLPQPLLPPLLTINKLETQTILKNFAVDNRRELIGLCPGAEFGPAKRWPHYHYLTLAKKLIDSGYQLILFGSIKDYEIGQLIQSGLSIEQQNYCRNLAGETSLDQAILLIAACRGIVSNDSGLMHIASALERPLVALYGPTSAEFAPPLSKNASVIRLIKGHYKIRKGKGDNGYHQSLIDIQPEQVFDTLINLLSSSTVSIN